MELSHFVQMKSSLFFTMLLVFSALIARVLVIIASIFLTHLKYTIRTIKCDDKVKSYKKKGMKNNKQYKQVLCWARNIYLT